MSTAEALVEFWPSLAWQAKAKLAAAAGASAYLAAASPPLGVAAGAWAAYEAARAGVAHWRWIRRWLPHYHEYIEPLHLAVAAATGHDVASTNPLAYLDVPPELLDAEGGVTVSLVSGPIPGDATLKYILDTTAAKLRLERYRHQWVFGGGNNFLRLTAAPPEPKVPEIVRWADVYEDVILKAKPSFLPLGIGLHNKVRGADVASETPHILFSCRTGWGKSSTVGIAAAHVLHHGGEVIIPDIKIISLEHFEGLPGVTYEDTLPGIHNVLGRVGVLLEHRNRAVKDAKRAGRPRPDFPRVLVVLEELNACRKKLATYWQEVKEKGDKRPSPALAAYEDMLLMGRAVNINCIAITQSGTAHAVGGPAYREQFGTRILGWYTQNAWKMLIPEHPYVMATDRPGHGYLARGTNAWECQFIYATDEELVAYATTGKAPANSLAQATQARGLPSLGAAHDPGSVGSDPGGAVLTLVPPIDTQDRLGPISLREASSDEGYAGGIVPLTLNQLHNDRKRRRHEFPKPLVSTSDSGDLYDRQDLIDWAAKRASKRRRKEA